MSAATDTSERAVLRRAADAEFAGALDRYAAEFAAALRANVDRHGTKPLQADAACRGAKSLPADDEEEGG